MFIMWGGISYCWLIYLCDSWSQFGEARCQKLSGDQNFIPPHSLRLRLLEKRRKKTQILICWAVSAYTRIFQLAMKNKKKIGKKLALCLCFQHHRFVYCLKPALRDWLFSLGSQQELQSEKETKKVLSEHSQARWRWCVITSISDNLSSMLHGGIPGRNFFPICGWSEKWERKVKNKNFFHMTSRVYLCVSCLNEVRKRKNSAKRKKSFASRTHQSRWFISGWKGLVVVSTSSLSRQLIRSNYESGSFASPAEYFVCFAKCFFRLFRPDLTSEGKFVGRTEKGRHGGDRSQVYGRVEVAINNFSLVVHESRKRICVELICDIFRYFRVNSSRVNHEPIVKNNTTDPIWASTSESRRKRPRAVYF